MTVTTFKAPAGHSRLSVDLATAIRSYAAGRPRSRQRRIGPSEIGNECLRRIGFSALGYEPSAEGGDPWPAFVGTATHAELAHAFEADNARLGRERWLVEQRVAVSGGITGTVDLFDTDTATVVDHKVVGPTTMTKVKAANHPGERYRIQTHLYGYGLAAAGHPVEHVAVAFYPRSGWLDGRTIWTEPYDPTVAEAALHRLASVIHLAGVLDVDDFPERWAHIPATPGPECAWCPFFNSAGTTDRDKACCPGTAA